MVDGTYYVYYSVSTFGSQESAIGLATSSSMNLDTWTDHGRIGIDSYSGSAYNAIDGNLFLDGSTYYMQFGSFWGDIYQVQMNSAATLTAGTSSHNLAYDPSGDHAEEGSYLYKYGSYYYLFYSWGICCGYDTSLPTAGQEYKIKVCRSTSPTSGFVCLQSDSSNLFGRGLQIDRLTQVELPAQQVVVQSFWRATVLFMGLVGSKYSLIYTFMLPND